MQMQSVNLREFQRYFSRFKNSACTVVDKGIAIGIYTPLGNGLFMPVGQPSDIAPKSEENGLVNTVGHACEKCSQNSEDIYLIWEDGEERKVCLNCIKRVMPANMLKGFLRRNKKL